MDYESKYNELVEAVRTVVEGNPGLCKIDEGLGRLSKLLPEKESEDERIRKEIIQFFKDASNGKTRVIASETFVKWAEFFEERKEQKPVKLNDDTEVGLDRALQIVKAAKGNLYGYQSDDGIYECDHAIQTLESILKNGIEQKPTEWSEDFEENIRNLLHDKLTGLIDNKTLKDIVNGIWFYVGKEALKYPNKELSQSEWSEEDEWKRNELLKYLEEKGDYRSTWYSWLEDLPERFNSQPHWKPSREQMKALSNAINIVGDDIGEDSATVKLIGELYDDLESFLTQIPPTQPHWKPSREQMDALRKVTYKMGNSCFGKSAANDENLHNLYVALKKLI